MATADIQLLDELGELIEDLTTTGRLSLDEKAMKKVKSICKKSDVYIRHVYHLIMTQLKKDHSEVRLSAFQIIDQLFARSHVFRELLLEEFQVFLELTVESDFSQRLPPPKSAADILKKTALKAVDKWNEKFGNHYKKLALGHTYLRRVKYVEFDTLRTRSESQRQQTEERNTRRRNHLIQKLAAVENQISEMESEIKLCLTEMENCFKLLLPHPDEYEVHNLTDARDDDSAMKQGTTSTANLITNVDKEESNNEVPHPNVDMGSCSSQRDGCITHESHIDKKHFCNNETNKRNDTVTVTLDDEKNADCHGSTVVADHGLGSRSYTLRIDVSMKGPEIKETPDNSVIITTLREMNKELTQKLLPMASKWLAVLAKGENTQQRIHQVIDLKQAMEAARDKFAEIKLLPLTQHGGNMQEETTESFEVAAGGSSDDEFEDVPEKEGLELVIPSELRQEYGLAPLSCSTATSSEDSTGADQGAASKVNTESSQDSQQNLCDAICDPAASTTDMLKYRRVFRSNQQQSATATCTNTSSTSTGEDAEKRKKLLEEAPVVPFGVDLLFWNDPSGGAPSVIKHDSIHRFYGSKDNADEEYVPDEVKGQVSKRFMTFSGKFEPVKWACRAPLPSGKLCPRRDRFKCPFHGRIIPREEHGKPSDEQKVDTQNSDACSASDTATANQPEWQEIQNEIEAATGLDLGGKIKRKTRSKPNDGKETKLSKKAKYARLTDLKKHINTPRTRLEKKVLSQQAVRRVAEQMDSISRKINKSKFSHQFNYSMQQ